MSQPPAYYRSKDFTEDFGHETDHSALNAELDTASNSINDIRENLAILQADDGRLRPSVVTADSISAELRASLIEGVTTDAQYMLDQSLGAAEASMQSAAEAEASRVATAGLADQALDSANAAEDSAVQADLSAGSASDSATQAQDALNQILAGQVNTDWLATEGKAKILNKPTNLDEYGILEEVKAVSSSGVPVGMIATFAMKNPPPKYLVANGATLSIAAYPELYAAIGATWGATATTFNIPDLRGEFIRGWVDDSPVVNDAGRVFGSLQGQTVTSHSHPVSDPTHAHSVYDPSHAHGVADPGHAHSIPKAGGTAGTSTYIGLGGNSQLTSANSNAAATGIGIYAAATGIGIYGAATGISVGVAGSTDGHPRNIALRYCIKYE